jgi:hypothetical protein
MSLYISPGFSGNKNAAILFAFSNIAAKHMQTAAPEKPGHRFTFVTNIAGGSFHRRDTGKYGAAREKNFPDVITP